MLPNKVALFGSDRPRFLPRSPLPSLISLCPVFYSTSVSRECSDRDTENLVPPSLPRECLGSRCSEIRRAIFDKDAKIADNEGLKVKCLIYDAVSDVTELVT